MIEEKKQTNDFSGKEKVKKREKDKKKSALIHTHIGDRIHIYIHMRRVTRAKNDLFKCGMFNWAAV